MTQSKIEIVFTNGEKFEFDSEKPDELFSAIIKKIMIPFYKDTNDWMRSIRYAIDELDLIRRRYSLPDLDYQKMLFEQIHKALDKEIAELKGVDKIEILFLNMEDYIAEISKIMENKELDKEKKIRNIGNLLASLNTFELAELFYHYIDKCKQANS
ncbi:MAG: hypothetical protein ACTSU2_03940 [Promethearchaeota archaeon]